MRWFKEGLITLSRPKPMLTIFEGPNGIEAEPELERMECFSSSGAGASVTLFKSPMCYIVEVSGSRVTFWEFHRTGEEAEGAFRRYRLIISQADWAGRVAF